MKGKELEKLCTQRMEWEERQGNGCMWKCGVIASRKQDGEWIALQSFPDFEGLVDSLHFTFDAKVCHDASIQLDPTHFGKRQFKFLCKSSAFGGTGFLLIHFPRREMKTFTDDVRTVAFPVSAEHPFWEGFGPDSGRRTINRKDCDLFGIDVSWGTPGRMQTETPDIIQAVRDLREREHDPIPEPTIGKRKSPPLLIPEYGDLPPF